MIRALLPVLILILGLTLVLLFGNGDALQGPSQVLLILCGIFAVLEPIIYRKIRRERSIEHRIYLATILKKILESIKNVSIAIYILILVGALIASWLASGIIPGMILFGLDTIHPSIFLVGACIACAIVSLVSGSSWSTVGTIGVALMGMGELWGYSSGMVAGAILSGAYFGDKMSPLSDTTNLAASMSRVPLTSHIRFMIPGTLFSMVLTLVIYSWIGYSKDGGELLVMDIQSFLSQNYSYNIWTAIIPTVVFLSVAIGIPALPSLGLGIIGGAGLAFYQMNLEFISIFYSLFFGFQSSLGNPSLDELLSGGGIISMIPTILLIISAMIFGGCMEGSGKIEIIIKTILKRIHTGRGLILNTMVFCYFSNLTTSDQYLSVVIPGKTMRDSFERMKVDERYLARALEDAGTITSVLIPWNSCGAFMSSTLGINTIKYSPFCFFHWIHILVSIYLALMNNRLNR
ncbi:MAG: Na+/H+ antiporter NhaC [Leptospira sp.]|nr:Na+/H+ antiporter NhaC [Leptospira sp.]